MEIKFDLPRIPGHQHPKTAEMTYVVTEGRDTPAKAMFVTWDEAYWYRGIKGGIIFEIGKGEHEVA